MSDGTPDGDLCAYAASGNLDGMLGAIQRGADVHYRRRLGAHYHIRTVSSPILYAVKNRELAAARFLLDRGVSTETRERNGGTLLIETASRPHQSDAIPMARLLLRHGAHVEAKNRAGFTAIQTAMTTPFGDVCVEMAKLLKVHGASTTGLLAKVQEARTRYESEYFPDDEESERADREKRWRAMIECVESVEGRSPFEVAIVNGMHADATAALQLGHIDPACCLQRAAEIRRAAALSNCPTTMALADLVLADWSPLNHHLYCLTSDSRVAIKPVLLVANRLRADAEQAGVGNAGAVPVLLPEIWTRVISFIVCRQLRADAEDCPEDSDAGDEDVEFDDEDDDEEVDEDEEFDDEDDEDDEDEDDEDDVVSLHDIPRVRMGHPNDDDEDDD